MLHTNFLQNKKEIMYSPIMHCLVYPVHIITTINASEYTVLGETLVLYGPVLGETLVLYSRLIPIQYTVQYRILFLYHVYVQHTFMSGVNR